MKTTSIKALLILVGSMLISTRMSAGIGEKIKNFVGTEYSQFHVAGLYVVGGIVLAGLLIYVLVNYFVKEDEAPQRQGTNFTHHRRHHHHHKIVKKSS